MNIEIFPKDLETDTERIQASIDDCYLRGGGEIILNKGVYNVGGLRLRSNITLRLKSGAVLKGSRRREDYDILEGDTVEPISEDCPAKKEYWNFKGMKDRWHNALLRIVNAENVTIIGEKDSVIDGSNCYDPDGEEGFRGPHAIGIRCSSNIKLSGYTVRDSANWAHCIFYCENIECSNITVLAGHDGIHTRGCDNVKISDCRLLTGDDCIAGFDNYNVEIRNCILNTACNVFRFGGTHVRISDCRAYAPAEYFHRSSLSLEDKISGTPSPESGRNNMLSFFTYFADFTFVVRHEPGDIIIENCKVESADRFFHYNFSGNEQWQTNKPISDITFKNICATGISLPLNAYGDDIKKYTLKIDSCKFSFGKMCGEFIRAANYELISIRDTAVENIEGPAVCCYKGGGSVEIENVTGITAPVELTDKVFSAEAI